tara:strand:- start:240 stop:452 length:213 start_codon:yes stop_codon:yes gene_type:complete
MDKKMERFLITALILILLGIGLSGCGTKTILIEEVKQPTEIDTIGKIPGIVNALGCMFAPNTCSNTEENK